MFTGRLVERMIKGMRGNGVGCTWKAELMCMTRNEVGTRKFKWAIVEHPANSADLAPSDHHLFLHLREIFGRREPVD